MFQKQDVTIHEHVNVTSPLFFSRRFKNICFRKSAHQILKTMNCINLPWQPWARNHFEIYSFMLWTKCDLWLEFFSFMITVNLGKFTLINIITNLTWKYLILQKRCCTAVWCTSTASQIVCYQKTVANKIEALCILLNRLSYPCHLSDMAPLFGRSI